MKDLPPVILVDTSAVLALFDPTDQFHTQAKESYAELLKNHVPLVMTNFFMAETYTIISIRKGPSKAHEFLTLARQEFSIERTAPEDETKAETILSHTTRSRNFSYFDVVSAQAAKRLGIHWIFTFDKDFHSLGLNIF